MKFELSKLSDLMRNGYDTADLIALREDHYEASLPWQVQGSLYLIWLLLAILPPISRRLDAMSQTWRTLDVRFVHWFVLASVLVLWKKEDFHCPRWKMLGTVLPTSKARVIASLSWKRPDTRSLHVGRNTCDVSLLILNAHKVFLL